MQAEDDLTRVMDALPVSGDRIERMRPVGGGCINKAWRVDMKSASYFVKSNSATAYPGMFDAEAKGLNILRESGTLPVPHVIGRKAIDENDYLVLEWVEADRRAKDFFSVFGRGLAGMHRHTQERFGLGHDNYIGSLPQSNSFSGDGIRFFTEQRLLLQAERAVSASRIDDRTMKMLDRLCSKLGDLLPREKPALLHGDLWNGNVMTGPGGRGWLIDPAVYYGWRESDLAMTMLFGGFDAEFYAAYEEAYPLIPGWRERTDLFNLYPLLVHVNLFGGGYAEQVKVIVQRYV